MYYKELETDRKLKAEHDKNQKASSAARMKEVAAKIKARKKEQK